MVFNILNIEYRIELRKILYNLQKTKDIYHL